MKYYKVIKENFLWEVGAILKHNQESIGAGYKPVNDVYKKSEHDRNEYISEEIVENCPEYFQRVYKVDLITKVVYETKDRAMELMGKNYKE